LLYNFVISSDVKALFHIPTSSIEPLKYATPDGCLPITPLSLPIVIV
jgi:hypothetical protein